MLYMRMFSATVRLGKTARPSGTAHRPWRASRSGDVPRISTPPKVTVPAVGTSAPLATLSNVDLPAPFGPSRANTDPSGTSSDTPWTTSIRP